MKRIVFKFRFSRNKNILFGQARGRQQTFFLNQVIKNLAYFLGFWTELNLEKNIISFKKNISKT